MVSAKLTETNVPEPLYSHLRWAERSPSGANNRSPETTPRGADNHALSNETEFLLKFPVLGWDDTF